MGNLEYRAGGPRVDYGNGPQTRVGRDPNWGRSPELPLPLGQLPIPGLFPAVSVPKGSAPGRVYNESIVNPAPPPRRGRARRERMDKSLKGTPTMQTQLAALRYLTGDVTLPDELRKAVDPAAIARIASENAKKRNRGPGGKFGAGSIGGGQPGTTGQRIEPGKAAPAPGAAPSKPAAAPVSPPAAAPGAAAPGAVTQDAAATPPASPLAHLPADTKAPHALIETGTKLRDHLRTLQPGTDEHKHALAQYNAIRNAIAGHNEAASSTNQVPRGKDVAMPKAPAFVQGGEGALRTPKQFTLQLQRATTKEEALALGHYLESKERKEGLRGKDWDAAWDAIVAKADKLPSAAADDAKDEPATVAKKPAKKTDDSLAPKVKDSLEREPAEEAKPGSLLWAAQNPGKKPPAVPTPDANHDQAEAAPSTPKEKQDHAEVQAFAEDHIKQDAKPAEKPAAEKPKPAATPKPDPTPAAPSGDRPARPAAGRNLMDRARQKLERKERTSNARTRRDQRRQTSEKPASKSHEKARKLAEGLVDTLKDIQAEHTQENLKQ